MLQADAKVRLEKLGQSGSMPMIFLEGKLTVLILYQPLN